VETAAVIAAGLAVFAIVMAFKIRKYRRQVRAHKKRVRRRESLQSHLAMIGHELHLSALERPGAFKGTNAGRPFWLGIHTGTRQKQKPFWRTRTVRDVYRPCLWFLLPPDIIWGAAISWLSDPHLTEGIRHARQMGWTIDTMMIGKAPYQLDRLDPVIKDIVLTLQGSPRACLTLVSEDQRPTADECGRMINVGFELVAALEARASEAQPAAGGASEGRGARN
jgi:hypothetical protein